MYRYKLIGAPVMGLALILSILFITYQLPCPSNAQYTIFRIVLSIAVAAFAVILTGFFKFNYKIIITCGGGFAVFVFTYIYTPALIQTGDKCNEPFDYTIFLQDSVGNMPLRSAGTMAIMVNNELKRLPIDQEGSCTFKQIPFSLKDSSVSVQLEVDGWQFANSKKATTVSLTGKRSVLIVEQDNSLCCISGSVRDERNRAVDEVRIQIGDIGVTTNGNGRFTISIPPGQQREEYKLIAEKAGYETFASLVYPKTKQDVEIVLVQHK
jgi:hypothetical protein